MASLLTALRDELVAADLVRKPSVVGSKPPLWLEPRLGTPAPGEGASSVERGDPVVAAYLTGGFAPDPYGSFMRKPIIDFRYRGTNAQTIETLYVQITLALIDRRDFMLGSSVHVIECEEWRALQRLGSDEQGFEYVSAFWFETPRQ